MAVRRLVRNTTKMSSAHTKSSLLSRPFFKLGAAAALAVGICTLAPREAHALGNEGLNQAEITHRCIANKTKQGMTQEGARAICTKSGMASLDSGIVNTAGMMAFLAFFTGVSWAIIKVTDRFGFRGQKNPS